MNFKTVIYVNLSVQIVLMHIALHLRSALAFTAIKKESEEDSMCFPICSPECINGNCTAPDSCECFDGFELSDDPGVCKPYCSEGCNNSVCTAPKEYSCVWVLAVRETSLIVLK
ncbi:hypothetical protein J6590_023959 [Homalodisca vitripennis]|nr:hypothetical protein J6590_023959 [Homalodisca vitripennis]